MSETLEEYQWRTYRYVTRCKWISGVTREATARWLMIIDLTLRVNSTRSYTRVFALVINTSLRVSAVRILNAFRSAAFVGITSIIGQTSARSRAIALFTYGICTARWRIAWQLHWEDNYRTKMFIQNVQQYQFKIKLLTRFLKGIDSTQAQISIVIYFEKTKGEKK